MGRAQADPSVGHSGARTARFSSLPCQGAVRWHEKGFSPFVSFCDAQDKRFFVVAQKHKDLPQGGTWAGGW